MNSLKKKDNLVKFERDYENLINLSFKRREEGDYVGAISIMRNLLNSENASEVYAQIADIYADMDLNEIAVNAWYKFLRFSPKKYYKDGYNGLGANFFLAGNDALAGYYFNKQLESGSCEDCVYEEELEDYFDTLAEKKNAAYKVVYPVSQNKIDEENYKKGKKFLEDGEYGSALKEFEKINEDSDYYYRASADMAYASFALRKVEDAYYYAARAIEGGDISVYALSLAINSCALVGLKNELGNYIDMLLEYKAETDEEKYKKLNLLINLNLKDVALEYSEEVLKCLKYQSNVYYLRGILYYNAKDYFKAEEAFRYAYIIDDNPVSEFYLKIATDALNGKPSYKKLDFGFDLPEKEAVRRIKLIKDAYDEYNSTKTVKFPKNFLPVIRWVYFGNNQTLQVALAILICASGKRKYIDQLYNALIETFISDEVKHRIISVLCESGISGKICVVYGYIFRKITVPKSDFSGEGGDIVNRAYSYALGRLSVIEDCLSPLVTAAKRVFKKLIENGNALQVDDPVALSCVIYKYSGLKTFDSEEFIYRFFGSDKESVNKTLEKVEYEKS